MSTMEAESEVLRFNDVQVYVHGLLAASILLLWVTGLPITFHDSLGWVIGLVGYGNLVNVHVLIGAVLIATSIFYLVYGALGRLAGHSSLRNVLPRLGDLGEAIEHLKYLAGWRDHPESGKYTFLQKAEVWIIIVETTAMIATGLVLWGGTITDASPAPAMLIFRDVHAIVAVTMLLGVTFHLFMTHAKEFPLDRSMFTGTVTLGRACEEWEGWIERSVGYVDAPCPEETAGTALTTGVIVGMILFGAAWTGVILEYVLSPVPTGGLSVAQGIATNEIPGGLIGLLYTVGLNVALVVVVLAIVALIYGFVDRWTVS
ncbi:MAG: cytochrome b/b6 domain-containing protein [Halodesulfurarchaeum sp.]|nr:cytochrome b/b6 domain-containing protein [Halodesulfurarchaeum sp.]